MSDTVNKPVFVQTLVDTTINEGEKLKLRAAINAHPEPEVNLYFAEKDRKNRVFPFLQRLFGIEIIFH